jgi:N-acetylmuramoyl-L-alanine amidase
MGRPPYRETRELIDQLRSKRQRRKKGQIVLIVVGVVVVLAGIITGVSLATGSSSGGPASTLATTKVMTTTKTTAPATTSTNARPATTATVTSTAPSSSTSEAATTTTGEATTTSNWLAGKVVTIDPGHQAQADSGLEPIGPGSSTKKAKVSSGTASPTTGTPESEVTLAVGLKVRDALEALGVKVVMTRTTQNVDVSNSERAKIANKADADLAIRIHCDGSTDHSVRGLSTLYPASIKGWTDDIAATSKKAASVVHRALIAATGAADRGTRERSDLTGFNWSDVPDVLVEMGYMTNAAEDKLLESQAYQDKIVQGMVNGIVEFLRTEQ